MSFIRQNIFFTLVFCLFLHSEAGFAENVAKPVSVMSEKNPLASDTTKIRMIDDGAVEELARQSAFHYNTVAPERQQNLLKSAIGWIFYQIDRLFFEDGKPNLAGLLIKYIFFAGLGAGLLYVAIKYLGLDFGFIKGSSKKTALAYEEGVENIHEIDFDRELAKLISERNYRLAVRFRYLKTLKLLSDKSLIEWHPEKTNRRYVAELTTNKPLFAKLTASFDYVWYGDFPIDETKFSLINADFLAFEKSIR